MAAMEIVFLAAFLAGQVPIPSPWIPRDAVSVEPRVVNLPQMAAAIPRGGEDLGLAMAWGFHATDNPQVIISLSQVIRRPPLSGGT